MMGTSSQITGMRPCSLPRELPWGDCGVNGGRHGASVLCVSTKLVREACEPCGDCALLRFRSDCERDDCEKLECAGDTTATADSTDDDVAGDGGSSDGVSTRRRDENVSATGRSSSLSEDSHTDAGLVVFHNKLSDTSESPCLLLCSPAHITTKEREVWLFTNIPAVPLARSCRQSVGSLPVLT